MRHATARAINFIYPWYEQVDSMGYGWKNINDGLRLACDWSEFNYRARAEDELFTGGAAQSLVKGRRVDLPTCPACAALLDLALELSGKG